MPTRILIADDDDVIRSVLRRIVEENPDWQICGEARNGTDAIAQAQRLAPDIAILDLTMPQMNGLDAARLIRETTPTLPMLLLTVEDVSAELETQAIKAGFSGAVSKSTGYEVVQGIKTLLRRRPFFKPS
jgi:DNA-binding NarL/FixJ family response regulator